MFTRPRDTINRMRIVKASALCLILFTSSLPGFSQSSVKSDKAADALRQRLQEKLNEFYAAGKFPGATAGFALPDGTSFGLAVGLSNVETKTAMTSRDLMLQGSVGKTYVAAVAMQLISEKKLSLDDRIEKYLGGEKWFSHLPNARDITVRMLMNHTSGLVRYEFKEQFTRDLTANPDKVWKPEELIAYILDTPAPFAAGAGWDYSDTNYIVLGMIIERVTGSTYYRELSRRILTPLGLSETTPSDRRTIRGLAQGYAGKDNPFGGADAMLAGGRMVINPQFEWTGGGIASTAQDLARWARLLYEGKAFDPQLLNRMLEGVPARLGPEAKYGLGVIIRPTRLGITYGHSGFFPGYITEVMYFPELKAAIAVQVNTSVPRATPEPLGRLITELAEIIRAEQKGFAELERVVQDELKESNTPGAAVAIVNGDRIIYARGFGVANIETGAPVTPDMLFRLGSTTKMFTAAALVTLSAQGRLKLDVPIGNYASGLSPQVARLSLHQLLSHTAGMADFQAPFISQDDEALARMVRTWKQDALFAEPGQIYSYSSPGYWLAGYVLEEANRKPYADSMSELIFAPLGMTRSTLRPLQALTFPLAMGHSASGTEKPQIIRPAFNNVAMWPAGSIYSSVNELSRFVIAMMNKGLLEGRQALPVEVPLNLFGKHTSMPGHPEVTHGYGLLGFEERGVRVVSHGGFSRGYGSMIQMVPDERFAVIVQTNRSGITLPRTRAKAMELFLRLKPETAEAPRTAQSMSEAERQNFAGRYLNGPQTWEIILKDGKLFYKQEEKQLELTRTAPYRLSFGDNLESELIFVANAQGRIEYLFDGLYSARKIK
jgi:D-alanyl-D-alanine carboxypeptidase